MNALERAAKVCESWKHYHELSPDYAAAEHQVSTWAEARGMPSEDLPDKAQLMELDKSITTIVDCAAHQMPYAPIFMVDAAMCQVLMDAWQSAPLDLEVEVNRLAHSVIVFEEPIRWVIEGDELLGLTVEVNSISCILVEDGSFVAAPQGWYPDDPELNVDSFHQGQPLAFDIGASSGHLEELQQAARLVAVMESVIFEYSDWIEPGKAPRSIRRRVQRAGYSSEYSLVTLRKLRPNGERVNSKGIEYSHQWLVTGHWRSLPSNKYTWVRPHIKGPEDKPLLLKKKVYKWIR